MTALEKQLEASLVRLADSESGSIVRMPAREGLVFTEQQEEMIRANFSTGATKSEFEVLMAIAKARKLNPLLKQVYFVKRKDKKLNKDVWSVQVSIDGLRAIAERTGAYDGQDEPEFEYNAEKEIILARVKVYKKGTSRPFVGVARWDEYVQKNYDGAPTKFWADMPFTMLGKCAEALAIRKAFPEDSGGLYVAEEMMQAEHATPPERQLGAINPHDQEGDSELGEPEIFEKLRAELATVDISLEVADSYQKVLTLREVTGYKAGSPTDWQRRYKAAEPSMNGAQRKEIGRLWNRCDRQLAKLEEKLKPGVEASFADADPAEDFDRGA